MFIWFLYFLFPFKYSLLSLLFYISSLSILKSSPSLFLYLCTFIFYSGLVSSFYFPYICPTLSVFFFYFSLSFIFPLFVISFMFPLKSNITLFTVFSCTYLKSPLQYFLISSTSLLTYVYLLCIPCFFVCLFFLLYFFLYLVYFLNDLFRYSSMLCQYCKF